MGSIVTNRTSNNEELFWLLPHTCTVARATQGGFRGALDNPNLEAQKHLGLVHTLILTQSITRTSKTDPNCTGNSHSQVLLEDMGHRVAGRPNKLGNDERQEDVSSRSCLRLLVIWDAKACDAHTVLA